MRPGGVSTGSTIPRWIRTWPRSWHGSLRRSRRWSVGAARAPPPRVGGVAGGGARTAAALAVRQGRGGNLRGLDEPTNHLDLPAIEQLESALDSLNGTVLLVTHDRQMLQTVRTTRCLRVEAGVVTDVT